MKDRGFELYEETFLHYGRQRFWFETFFHYGRWRLVSITERGFHLYEDPSCLQIWARWRLASSRKRVSRYMKTFLHYGRQSVWVIWRLFSIMADRAFEQDEDLSLLWRDLSPLWQTEVLRYMKTFLNYQTEGWLWRPVSIIADRGFALYGDFSPLWQTECLSYMKTFLHHGWQRVEQDEDLSLLWKTEGLTYIKTCLHYGRQRVGVIWRLFSIMADRGLELYEDLSPLWQIEGLSYMETCFYYARQRVEQDEHYEWKRVWLIWRLFSIMADRGFEQDEDLPPL